MPNVIRPQIDGPLKIEGEIELLAADGSLLKKAAKLWLCRCGRSGAGLFCDGSHTEAGFRDCAAVAADYRPKVLGPGMPGPVLRVTRKPDGPLRCFGDMRVEGADGSSWSGDQASLCRCGASNNKPFCDGSHRETR